MARASPARLRNSRGDHCLRISAVMVRICSGVGSASERDSFLMMGHLRNACQFHCSLATSRSVRRGHCRRLMNRAFQHLRSIHAEGQGQISCQIVFSFPSARLSRCVLVTLPWLTAEQTSARTPEQSRRSRCAESAVPDQRSASQQRQRCQPLHP